MPEAISSTEELYLTGLHLQQYRHATTIPGAVLEKRRFAGTNRTAAPTTHLASGISSAESLF